MARSQGSTTAHSTRFATNPTWASFFYFFILSCVSDTLFGFAGFVQGRDSQYHGSFHQLHTQSSGSLVLCPVQDVRIFTAGLARSCPVETRVRSIGFEDLLLFSLSSMTEQYWVHPALCSGSDALNHWDAGCHQKACPLAELCCSLTPLMSWYS